MIDIDAIITDTKRVQTVALGGENLVAPLIRVRIPPIVRSFTRDGPAGCRRQGPPCHARKRVRLRRRRLRKPDGKRHPQIRADRVSSVLAGEWDGSGEPIASRQAQRACPPAQVVKVARFVGSTVGAAGRLGVG